MCFIFLNDNDEQSAAHTQINAAPVSCSQSFCFPSWHWRWQPGPGRFIQERQACGTIRSMMIEMCRHLYYIIEYSKLQSIRQLCLADWSRPWLVSPLPLLSEAFLRDALTLDGGDSGSLDHEMEFQSIRCQLPGTMVPSIQRPAHLLHHYCRGWNKLSFYNTTITEIQRYAVHTFGSGYQWLLAESAPGLCFAVQCAPLQ